MPYKLLYNLFLNKKKEREKGKKIHEKTLAMIKTKAWEEQEKEKQI